MVRVISDGPVKTKKIVCPHCAYELEYTGEDISVVGEDMTKVIYCPRPTCASRARAIAVRWP